MRPRDENTTSSFLDGLTTIPVDIPIARRAGTVSRDFRAKGITVDMGDAIIGSTALELGAPLVTNNVVTIRFQT
jgi:predicted nucleic acid-binding protein